jgi:hypothetical protein
LPRRRAVRRKTKYKLIKAFNAFMISFVPLFPLIALTTYLVFKSIIPFYCDQGLIILSLLLYFGVTMIYVSGTLDYVDKCKNGGEGSSENNKKNNNKEKNGEESKKNKKREKEVKKENSEENKEKTQLSKKPQTQEKQNELSK